MKRRQIGVFRALGDPNRIRIIKMLEARQLCVCEVREVLGLSTSTASKHLSVLRDADLIVDARDGKWVNYRLNTRSTSRIVRSVLGTLRTSFEDDADVLADRRKVRQVDRGRICGL